jgi:hypothetical protein
LSAAIAFAARNRKAGYGRKDTQQGLDWPYDAKVVGDYTGITPPD